METGLAVTADRTKDVVRHREQNAGQSQNVEIDEEFFENIINFKYLVLTLINQNCMHEEIKSSLGCAMSQSFSRRPPTTEAWVR
jgi:hypothetical protein